MDGPVHLIEYSLAECAQQADHLPERPIQATDPVKMWVMGSVKFAMRGNGVPYGIRTRAANVKGWCPRPLDERD